MLILALAMCGCTLQFKKNGLLLKEDNKVYLRTIQGESYHIHAGKDGKYLEQLGGCQIQLQAKRLLNHLWLDSWVIQDAGDGSAPFLGRLERRGIQWVMNDLNSKALYILDGLDLLYTPQNDQVVLVVGYINGPHLIKVVSVKVLEP